MPVSEAKINANRRNSLLSTGPITELGKSIVRRNAFKHGLTGQGVALPTEDHEAIEARFINLQDQMKPNTVAGEQLLRRFAFLTVRIARCEEVETARTALNIRPAEALFDDERLAGIEALTTHLIAEPATTVRRLQKSPEGIDWLIQEWGALRDDLLNPHRDCWTGNHRTRMDLLMGRPRGGYRIGRVQALSEALSGFFYNIDPVDGEGLDDSGRMDWARDQLRGQIDAEVERLREVRSRIDPTILEQDRTEAATRALFDASPEASLARLYEANTERAMHKTLSEYRKVELEGERTVVVEIQPVEMANEVELNGQVEVEPDDPVALSFQEAEIGVAEEWAPTISQVSIGSEPIATKTKVESIGTY